MMGDRVRLRGGLPGTASWVWFDDDGSLNVEFYDFSAESEDWFGNDVALVIRIGPAERGRIEQGLNGIGRRNLTMSDTEILESIGGRFDSYFGVKGWLDELAVCYSSQFDSRA